MDHFQYLLVMAACLVVTLPLEFVLGARVWRRPARLAAAVLPPLILFSLWDVCAIADRWWSFSARYVSGWRLPGRLPVEELAFFVVVPVCALLTFEVVSRILAGAAGTEVGTDGSARHEPTKDR